jgi:hypothetical protein
MRQILHGSATTTEAVRRAIQHSQESLRGLAKRYGVNVSAPRVTQWIARPVIRGARWSGAAKIQINLASNIGVAGA